MFGRSIGFTCLFEKSDILTSEEGNNREGIERREEETSILIWGRPILEITSIIKIKKGKSSRIWNTESL